jgi:hypothetical protein
MSLTPRLRISNLKWKHWRGSGMQQLQTMSGLKAFNGGGGYFFLLGTNPAFFIERETSLNA